MPGPARRSQLKRLLVTLSPAQRRHLQYRRRLESRVGAAMEGRAGVLAIPAHDLESHEADLELVFGPILRTAGIHARLRLLRALRSGGVLAEVADALDSESGELRLAAARVAGAARLPGSVGGLARLLDDPDHRVRRAAAKALGRIGGAAATDALLSALRRRRLSAERLTADLSRAAPDRYLEQLLLGPYVRAEVGHVAIAYGLRRGSDPLLLLGVLHESGLGPRETSQVLRALGYLRDAIAIPALLDRLDDPAWQVRAGACEALGRFRQPELLDVLRARADDAQEDARVRRAARQAVRRTGGRPAAPPVIWSD